jgi:ankyrin repeat protein
MSESYPLFREISKLLRNANSDQFEKTRNFFFKYPEFNLNSKDGNGKGLLHYAVDSGRAENVGFLLQFEDLDRNLQNTDGKTAFYYACENEKTKCIEVLLLDLKVNVDLPTKDSKSPVMILVERNYPNEMKMLIESGKQPSILVPGITYTLITTKVTIDNEANRIFNAYSKKQWDRSWGKKLYDFSSSVVSGVVSIPGRVGTGISTTMYSGPILGVASMFASSSSGKKGEKVSGETEFLHNLQLPGLERVTAELMKGLKSFADLADDDVPAKNERHLIAKGTSILLTVPGADINTLVIDDLPLLHYACLRGHAWMVQVLLQHPDIDVNLSNGLRKMEPPLHTAIAAGHGAIVKLLLADPRLNINEVWDQKTPLMLAFEKKASEVVEEILCSFHQLTEPTEVNDLDKNYRTYYNWLEKSVGLVQRIKTNLRDSKNPAMFAVDLFAFVMESIYLKREDKVKFVAWRLRGRLENQGQVTLFSMAAAVGSETIFSELFSVLGLNDPKIHSEILLRCCEFNLASPIFDIMRLVATASPLTGASDGKIPLILAIKYNNIEAVEACLTCQSQLNLGHTTDENSAMKKAEKREKIALLFERYRVDWDKTKTEMFDKHSQIKNNEQRMMALATNGSADLFAKFREVNNVDPNAKGQLGQTALHLACNKGNLELVKALLSVETTDPNITDDSHRTALHVLIEECKQEENRHVGILKLLLGHRKLNPYLVYREKTSFHMIVEKRFREMFVAWLASGRSPVKLDTIQSYYGPENITLNSVNRWIHFNFRKDAGTERMYRQRDLEIQYSVNDVVSVVLGAALEPLMKDVEDDVIKPTLERYVKGPWIVVQALREPTIAASELYNGLSGDDPANFQWILDECPFLYFGKKIFAGGKESLLEVALQKTDSRWLDLLLKKLPPLYLNIRGRSGLSPLSAISTLEGDQSEKIQKLLSHPAINPNYTEDNGKTPLVVFIERENLKATEAILSSLRNISLGSANKADDARSAAADSEEIEELLDEYKGGPKLTPASSKNDSLVLALKNGDQQAVECILNSGFTESTMIKDGEEESSLVIYLVENNFVEALVYFISTVKGEARNLHKAQKMTAGSKGKGYSKYYSNPLWVAGGVVGGLTAGVALAPAALIVGAASLAYRLKKSIDAETYEFSPFAIALLGGKKEAIVALQLATVKPEYYAETNKNVLYSYVKDEKAVRRKDVMICFLCGWHTVGLTSVFGSGEIRSLPTDLSTTLNNFENAGFGQRDEFRKETGRKDMLVAEYLEIFSRYKKRQVVLDSSKVPENRPNLKSCLDMISTFKDPAVLCSILAGVDDELLDYFVIPEPHLYHAADEWDTVHFNSTGESSFKKRKTGFW